MTTIPEPNAILADLRDRGHDDLPDVDIRVGASVLDGAIADARARPGMPAPLIISDGGPYRTPAGPVVDRLAERLGCPECGCDLTVGGYGVGECESHPAVD